MVPLYTPTTLPYFETKSWSVLVTPFTAKSLMLPRKGNGVGPGTPSLLHKVCFHNVYLVKKKMQLK